MNIEYIREYCLAKPFVSEGFPFGDNPLVFKVHNKVFLLLSLDDSQTFNVKCNPEQALVYRAIYPEIVPGYHMNKTHWNTVNFNGSLPNNLILDMINHSYELVFNSLPKKVKLNQS
ncbi:MAG: MmcQ/YjbR family DNA-binding protein [Sphingobacteriales bacterium]|nr:MAG: MmcQ/YjbR family DNA-binding protein [Sphingobacteriales bacterium]TAF79813.1 MAG: MmcQ/YjbR family DNA-binding protein [Sphingobacteriales bacterium]